MKTYKIKKYKCGEYNRYIIYQKLFFGYGMMTEEPSLFECCFGSSTPIVFDTKIDVANWLNDTNRNATNWFKKNNFENITIIYCEKMEN